jgi:putative N6-adenine-specific DNA methylase
LKDIITQKTFSDTGEFDISIKTMFNLEDILSREIEMLGGTAIDIGTRIVHCKGDFEFLCKANLHLRTALRVLVPIISFESKSPEELYEVASLVEWDRYMKHDSSFVIDPVIHSARFPHSHYAALKLKDAIVDFFRKKNNSRPDIDVVDPIYRFNLHIDDDKINISLDSSGHSLNQRGYRVSGARAPLNEVLAAGMVMITGWRGELPLYDPMCGSGTIAIEAAMIASNMAPGLVSAGFGFMRWNEFSEEKWLSLVRDAKSVISKPVNKIYASDVVTSHVAVTQQNIARAGLKDIIDVQQSDFFKLEPASSQGTMIINPPYGERMEDGDMIHLYGEIGTRLKHSWSGHTAWIISSNVEAMKAIGLKPARKQKLLNGTLECSFNGYELFRGARKDFVIGRKS